MTTQPPRHPPTIELDGARLRPLEAGDAAGLYDYLQDPVVTALTSYPVVTRAMVEGMLERYETRWAAGEPSKWAIALPPDDRIVGTCGFNEHSAAHRWAELAYELARPQWGTGLMRQVVPAVLQWAWQHDGIDRVHAYVRVDNHRSVGVLERNGFLREGCLRSFRVCRGQPHDFYVYARLRAEGTTARASVGEPCP